MHPQPLHLHLRPVPFFPTRAAAQHASRAPHPRRLVYRLPSRLPPLTRLSTTRTILLTDLPAHRPAQLLSTRPECRTRDGRLIRAYRRVFRPHYEPDLPPFEYDWQRTARLAAFGGAIAGPMGHAWFQLLDKRIMPNAPRRQAATALKQPFLCKERPSLGHMGRSLHKGMAAGMSLSQRAKADLYHTSWWCSVPATTLMCVLDQMFVAPFGCALFY